MHEDGKPLACTEKCQSLFEIYLDEDDSRLLRDTIGENGDAIRLAYMRGLDGPGLYVSLTEYPEEGALRIWTGPSLPAPEPAGEASQAALDVLAERRRQVDSEGWTPEHDDQHGAVVLAAAAACYALFATSYPNRGEAPPAWPWTNGWWKPKASRENYKRAAALLIAAMECDDRRHGRRAEEARAQHEAAK